MLTNCWTGRAPQDLSPIIRDILDPVHFPPQNTWLFSTRYLQMVEEAKDGFGGQTESAAVECYRQDALERLRRLAAVDPNLDELKAVASFEATWPRLSEMLRKESFFYAWLKDHGVQDSAFLHTYFTDLSATAMGILMAFGKSVDITGQFREIPSCDAAYRFVRTEPTFRSFGGREWFRQQLMLRKAMEVGWKPELIGASQQPRKLRVLDLGAGLMPVIWNYELTPEIAVQIFDITAYDNSADMSRNVQLVFGGRTMAELGIDYRNQDLFQGLKEIANGPECGNIDVITIMGGVSYYTDRLPEILELAEKVLRPGGMLIFDRQVFDKSMLRCVKVLAWRGTSMRPDLSVQQAIDAVVEAVHRTGLTMSGYEVDAWNEQPAGVCFCLDKPV